MTYTTADIRQFLLERYADDELTTLCFDYFPAVHANLAAGMNKSQKIQLLLEYCQQRDAFNNLLAALERSRPEQYAQQFAVRVAVELPRHARDPRQIFISHAREDADLAHQLANDLRQKNWRVWIAPDSIRPGEKWVEAINRGLEESGIFVPMLTPDMVESKWAKSETDAAIAAEHSGHLRLIPIEIAACQAPPLLNSYQRVSFLQGYPAGLAELFRALESSAHPRMVQSATQPETAAPSRPLSVPAAAAEPRRLSLMVWLVPLVLAIIVSTIGTLIKSGDLPESPVRSFLDSVGAIALFLLPGFWTIVSFVLPWTYIWPRTPVHVGAKSFRYWVMLFALIPAFWIIGFVLTDNGLGNFFGWSLLDGFVIVSVASILAGILAWACVLGVLQYRQWQIERCIPSERDAPQDVLRMLARHHMGFHLPQVTRRMGEPTQPRYFAFTAVQGEQSQVWLLPQVVIRWRKSTPDAFRAQLQETLDNTDDSNGLADLLDQGSKKKWLTAEWEHWSHPVKADAAQSYSPGLESSLVRTQDSS